MAVITTAVAAGGDSSLGLQGDGELGRTSLLSHVSPGLLMEKAGDRCGRRVAATGPALQSQQPAGAGGQGGAGLINGSPAE